MDSTKQNQYLSRFLYADGVNFDSHERQNELYCFPDTRVDILRRIMKWSADSYERIIF